MGKTGTRKDDSQKASAVVLRMAFRLGAALLFAVALASCTTANAAIPEDLPSSVLIQRAQERSDVYDWKGAAGYYAAIIERFPSDPALVCAASYELAFIDYKRGDYTAARAGFRALLERYAAPGGEALPPTWKILAEKVLLEMPAVK